VFAHCHYCDEIEKNSWNSEWMNGRMHETEAGEGLDVERRGEMLLEGSAALTFVRVS
jgi:hypothetical protein